MQNDYILIPWDSIHQNHVWYNTEIVEYHVARYTPTKDSAFSISLEIAILGLLIYNIIIIFFLAFKNENVLHRKDKTIKKGQRRMGWKSPVHVCHKRNGQDEYQPGYNV